MDLPSFKNKKVEIFFQAVAYSLIIIGAVLIFGKRVWWPNYYSPIYFGLIFFSSAALIIFSQNFLKPPDQRRQESIILLRLAMSLALALNALGELYLYQLYKYGIQYDKLIHFADAFMFMVVLTSFYEKWHNYNLRRALRTAATIVIAGSLLWEVFEFSSDFFFKTAEFGIYGQFKTMDTIFDILSDLLGLTAGSVYATWRGWSNLLNKLLGYKRRPAAAKILECADCFPTNLATK